MTKKHSEGLDNRSRDEDGQIHNKRSDTKVGTLRKIYGENFLDNYSSDATLRTVLKKEKLDSLSELIKKNK